MKKKSVGIMAVCDKPAAKMLPRRNALHQSIFTGAFLGLAFSASAQTYVEYYDPVEHEDIRTFFGAWPSPGGVLIEGDDAHAYFDNADHDELGLSKRYTIKQGFMADSVELASGAATAQSGRNSESNHYVSARAQSGRMTANVEGSLLVNGNLSVRVGDKVRVDDSESSGRKSGAQIFGDPDPDDIGATHDAIAIVQSATLNVRQDLGVRQDLLIEATPAYVARACSTSGRGWLMRDSAAVTVGGNALIGGNLSMIGRDLETWESGRTDMDVVPISLRWSEIRLDVGKDLHVLGDVNLTGSTANAKDRSNIQAYWSARMAGAMAVHVGGNSTVEGALTLQAGEARTEKYTDVGSVPTASAQSVLYEVNGDLSVGRNVTLQAGGAFAQDVRHSYPGIATGGDSRLRVDGNMFSGGAVRVIAGRHESGFESRDSSGGGIATAGDAALAVGGVLYVTHPFGVSVEGEAGGTLQSNQATAALFGRATFDVGVLRTPAALFFDTHRVTIGTLAMIDTSTQLHLANTQPYDDSRNQGVLLGNLMFGAGNTLAITGNGEFTFRGDITVLGPNATYRGPALNADGRKLSFALPATAINGTTMLHTTSPISVQDATVALGANDPLKYLKEGDTITLIDSTTGRVANQGAYKLQQGAYQYRFNLQSTTDLTATLMAPEGAPAPGKSDPPAIGGPVINPRFIDPAISTLYRRAIGAGINALADSGSAISATDLRGPDRRGFFFSPEVGRTHIDNSGLTLERSNFLFGHAIGGATTAGDYIIAPLIEAGHTNYRASTSVAGRTSDGRGNLDNIGAGLLARHWFHNGAYAEASVRGGRIRGSYSDGAESSANYTSRSGYWGLHGKAGYVGTLSANAQLDSYVRVQWQRMGGDSVRNKASDELSYDATQLLRSRIGTRYVYDVGGTARVYAGAGWQYDTNSDVRARIDGAPLAKTNFNGGTGILEAGVRWEPSPLWSVRLNSQGQFGARQGVSGEAYVYRRF
ncbi:autotransporter outer membrane beta-barrel domain-containing protein [Achromobacter marplatensis]|uniref:autotransporter outer membrane beta-barrel domain-containing protein n=1 Tax=Achromobacter marplatensis TaxID=470868 RepID=UPI0039F65087